MKQRIDEAFWASNRLIAGIDEVGRGPLAGPLVVCAVILPIGYQNEMIDDSKKLTEKKRKICFELISKAALWISWSIVDEPTIDRLNIYAATKQAMARLAAAAPCDLIFTDAMPISVPNKEIHSYIHGDSLSINIAAASIMAKVVRDELMITFDTVYPEYGFAKHKGYPTPFHLANLEKFGICPIHRRSYAPVAKQLQDRLF